MSRVIAVMACGFMPCGFMLAAFAENNSAPQLFNRIGVDSISAGNISRRFAFLESSPYFAPLLRCQPGWLARSFRDPPKQTFPSLPGSGQANEGLLIKLLARAYPEREIERIKFAFPSRHVIGVARTAAITAQQGIADRQTPIATG
jgi:hypothetical protein